MDPDRGNHLGGYLFFGGPGLSLSSQLADSRQLRIDQFMAREAKWLSG